jgi:calcineurin-like phosphoesterase family protein
MSVWFTSDTHYRHRNIIKYCNRPFATAAEIAADRIFPHHITAMDEAMIANWNAVVKPEDTVYHLGDFAFDKKGDYAERVLNRLMGTKILVAGNHDPSHVKKLSGWASVHDYLEIELDGHMLVLAHFPYRVWNKVHKGAINLHGHSHGKFPGCKLQHDVGVDVWDFKPVQLDDLLKAMAKLPDYVPGDHHAPGMKKDKR